MNKLKEFLKTKLYRPILNFLQQGLSPEKLAEGISWGLVLGFIPLMGATTILCTLASMGRKINMAVIQLINWFVYPLQLLFFIPFLQAGGKITGSPIPFSFAQINVMIKNDPLAFIQQFAMANLGGILVWIAAAVPVWLVSYFILKGVFKKLSHRI